MRMICIQWCLVVSTPIVGLLLSSCGQQNVVDPDDAVRDSKPSNPVSKDRIASLASRIATKTDSQDLSSAVVYADILNELPELLDSVQENWEFCKAMFPDDHANQIACIKEILARVCEVLEACQGDISTGDTDGDGKCNDLDTDDDNDSWSDDQEMNCGSDPIQAGSVPVDSDEDSVCDLQDQCAGNDASGDTDGDLECNDLDTDDDADGWSDTRETACGTDPLSSASVPADGDSDGVCDPLDMCTGSDASGDNDGDGICDDQETPLTDYDFYKEIRILHSQVSGPRRLDGFPVLISRTDSDLRDYCQTDGDDIAFYLGVDRLDYEIEKYDPTTGKLTAWVRIPALSATTDTIILMYYGNSAMGISQANPAATWQNGFAGVWHLGENSGAIAHDSTANGFDGSHQGDITFQAGKVGNAYYFSGNDRIVTSAFPSDLEVAGNNPKTISVWTKNNDSFSEWGRVFRLGGEGRRKNIKLIIHVYDDQWVLALGGDNGQNERFTPYIPGSHGSWVHHVIVYVGGRTLKYFADGELIYSYTIGTYADAKLEITDEVPFDFGGLQYFTGHIDEVRVANTVRSAAWIATEYNNQSDPNGFYTVSSAVPVGRDPGF